jgi:GntR family transcriptional repressor for pyruvate dehydrogenase complex
MTSFKSLKKPPLSQAVETAIKESIAKEIFKPGEKLPSERELVEQFQVSRVTIREALGNLRSAGLVEIRRGINAGAYVSEPTADPITENFRNLIRLKKIDYTHLIDSRLYIEPRAALIAARHRSEADVHRLRALLDEAEGLIANSRKKARLKNVSFHCEVAQITENPIIVFITESITQSYSALIIEETSKLIDKEVIAMFIQEHRVILDAIVRQSDLEAYEKTRQHLLDTYQAYARVMPEESRNGIYRRLQREVEESRPPKPETLSQ